MRSSARSLIESSTSSRHAMIMSLGRGEEGGGREGGGRERGRGGGQGREGAGREVVWRSLTPPSKIGKRGQERLAHATCHIGMC